MKQLKTMNAPWHKAHPMPKNPTAKQRLVWHETHVRNCHCRKLSASAYSKLRRAANT